MAKTIQTFIIVTTGGDTARLARIEQGFDPIRGQVPSLRFEHLGDVTDLHHAYRTVIRANDDAETILLFCHQDVRPLTKDERATLLSMAGSLPGWLIKALEHPDGWFNKALELVRDDKTGVLGVAGAKGLTAETPWWSYPDLTGAIVHRSPGGKSSVNPYGPWGRAAVVDGVCLIGRGDTLASLGEPTEALDGFHFYDMDLCLRAHRAGLSNWTIPLLLCHESTGAPTVNTAWQNTFQRFVSLWGSALPLRISQDS
jgi:hypothetical protein